MAEVSRGHSSCLFGAKGRTCHERIEGYLSDWLDRSLVRGLVMEVGAGSPDGYNKCPEPSRRMVNETKLTPETEDSSRPLRNRTAVGAGGRGSNPASYPMPHKWRTTAEPVTQI